MSIRRPALLEASGSLESGGSMMEKQVSSKNLEFRQQIEKYTVGMLIAAVLTTGWVIPAIGQSMVERVSNLGNANGLTARGVVIANAEVTFSSSLAAPISGMPLKAGAIFKKGAKLVEFDCGKSRAALRGAKASEGKQLLVLNNREKLKLRNAATAFEVAEARAEFEVARARTDEIVEVMRFCQIDAPFNGRVLKLHADAYELPGPDTPLITVVDDSILELDLIVPSKWLQWISVGSKFEFSIDETGGTYQAVISRLGAKIDAVSQTIRITGLIDKRPSNLLPGMSGTARFDPPTL